jgi:hypothetical protein
MSHLKRILLRRSLKIGFEDRVGDLKSLQSSAIFSNLTKTNVEAPFFERGGNVQPAGGRSRL